ncbi:Uncharacterised protein [uncultured archaeon]|nr:Uncharacterised protein [uncultured archaeon]
MANNQTINSTEKSTLTLFSNEINAVNNNFMKIGQKIFANGSIDYVAFNQQSYTHEQHDIVIGLIYSEDISNPRDGICSNPKTIMIPLGHKSIIVDDTPQNMSEHYNFSNKYLFEPTRSGTWVLSFCEQVILGPHYESNGNSTKFVEFSIGPTYSFQNRAYVSVMSNDEMESYLSSERTGNDAKQANIVAVATLLISGMVAAFELSKK